MEKLYNPEIKTRYLKSKENDGISTGYHIHRFLDVSEYEIKNGDLFDFTLQEIMEYYKSLSVSSLSTLICLNAMFSDYTQFCLLNNLVKDGQNHYQECSVEILNTCINVLAVKQKIVSRETVLKWANQMPNPKDAFILLALFEYGKSGDYRDIYGVRPEDVDGNKMKLSNRSVIISDKMVDIIKDCKKEEKYYSITGGGVKISTLIDDGHIIKKYVNQNNGSDRQKGRNIYTACTRMFDFLGVEWMTPNDVVISGKIHFIKEKAKILNITSKE